MSDTTPAQKLHARLQPLLRCTLGELRYVAKVRPFEPGIRWAGDITPGIVGSDFSVTECLEARELHFSSTTEPDGSILIHVYPIC